MFLAQRRNRERRCTQGGASLCHGLSHFAPLGRGHHNPIVWGLPRFLATEWNNRGQPETPARRKSRVISVRRFEFFQPIAVLAAARYCDAATTYSLLSPKISKASSRVGRKECSFITRSGIGKTLRFPASRPAQRWSSVQDQQVLGRWLLSSRC